MSIKLLDSRIDHAGIAVVASMISHIFRLESSLLRLPQNLKGVLVTYPWQVSFTV